MAKDFKSIGLEEDLCIGLEKQGILMPTSVQEMIFQAFCQKKDLLVQSETGSGKTLAYLLPVFTMVDETLRSAQILILAPTHELAAQVYRQAQLLAENSNRPIRCALIIGGANIVRQIEKLKEKPQIIVGSAGRILDLIKRRKIAAHTVQTIVIDEADRLLDDMNLDYVKAVIKTTLRERQIVAFSASMSFRAQEVARSFMKDPQLMSVSKKEKMPDTIEHCFIVCDRRDKISMIRKIIAGQKPKKTIIFINNPENIEVTVEKLNHHGLRATGIYGLATKLERRKAMDDFREGRADILVSSDISARGLDIPGVTCVINLDIPEEPVHYLHRVGRTGRGGETGIAVSLVTISEKRWLTKYEKVYGIHLVQKEMSYGKLTDAKMNYQKPLIPKKKGLSPLQTKEKQHKKEFKSSSIGNQHKNKKARLKKDK